MSTDNTPAAPQGVASTMLLTGEQAQRIGNTHRVSAAVVQDIAAALAQAGQAAPQGVANEPHPTNSYLLKYLCNRIGIELGKDDIATAIKKASAALAQAGRAAPAGEVASDRCRDCGGTGMRDSGGTMPWGEPAMVACDCDDVVASIIRDVAELDNAPCETGEMVVSPEDLRVILERHLATPATEPAAPGYVSVPANATKEMCIAGMKRMFEDRNYSAPWEDVFYNCWRAMLAAASTVQGKEKP